jgi:hypothetical protein
MGLSAIVQSSVPNRIGSFLTALGLVCWACLVGLGLARIFTGAPGSSRTWTWRPLSRQLSPKHLEHHALRAVTRSTLEETSCCPIKLRSSSGHPNCEHSVP